jgi:hypothetical protein
MVRELGSFFPPCWATSPGQIEEKTSGAVFKVWLPVNSGFKSRKKILGASKVRPLGAYLRSERHRSARAMCTFVDHYCGRVAILFSLRSRIEERQGTGHDI